ncbi:hypothetical protein [Bradyrhizobium vignae]|uniref:17 kDa surface antigen n=1 Tax=Bradyrhizobium vignae TaxID=1549949 RepID=A0ABS3ZNP6_9BRAD|nr:hypothetical protein [Bradyrhizobium vignae]MBP0109781.1 hypothetical protein [Bradyrhizobium vignae]RXG96075.1 hypothetical protein EAV90_23740 [Bradyrhizobium vignae]
MSASKRMKIIIPVISAMSLFALSAQAQEARPPKEAGPPPAAPGAGAPPQTNQTMRKVPPPQQATRPVQPGSQPHAGPGPRNADGPSPRRQARGPAPVRDWGGHTYRGNLAWDGGRWRHEVRNGRSGWWWDVGGVWYYYPERMAGPPAYISEDYIDDVPVAYAPPPVAYAPPPPPPPPADPGASALGGAIVGGLLGGLISGNATGAAAGAVLGGATGAIAGATAASQPGYYWAQGTCYYRYPNGQYVQADPRACY